MLPYVPEASPLASLDFGRLIRQIGPANAALARYDGLLQSAINSGVMHSLSSCIALKGGRSCERLEHRRTAATGFVCVQTAFQHTQRRLCVADWTRND
jgi:hypothetical protein